MVSEPRLANSFGLLVTNASSMIWELLMVRSFMQTGQTCSSAPLFFKLVS